MNKTELVEAMANDAQISKIQAKAALESFISNVSNALAEKEGKVSLVGFGTFSRHERAAKKGHNPSTGKPMDIAAKSVAKFKPGAELARAVHPEKAAPAKKKK